MTRTVPRYCVIPTRNRPDVFRQAYDAISTQVDEIIVINNGDEPLVGNDAIEIMKREQPPNLSKFWNIGLKFSNQLAEHAEAKKWDVAIINDDCIVPEGWFDAVSNTMRSMNVAAGCSGGQRGYPILHTQPGPVGLETRMQGFAFVLAGEKGARANEQLKWYFTDDHLDWLSRKLGGMVMVPGFHVCHLYPNGQMTPELQEQIAKDAAKFTAYWGGMRPW